MFLRFNEEKCPVCGTLGEDSKIEELNSCPNCGTKFNKFGVVASPNNKNKKLQWT